MIFLVEPSEVSAVAAKRMDSNMRFRTYLRNHADCDKLDSQFAALHKELFSSYDCCQCHNCCEAYQVILEEGEAKAIAGFLGQSEGAFIDAYLAKAEDGYEIRGKPCPFLCADGRCRIQECKPSSCKGYPFMDQPDRMGSLYGVLEFSEVCPIVLEILERLKQLYRFRDRK